MKKLICLLICVLLCTSLMLPAMATGEGDFVPSITYKEGPTVQSAEMDQESVAACIVITSISQAEKKETDIHQEERDLLLDLYEQLENGTMTLPLEGSYTIRELLDISFAYEECRQDAAHGGKDEKLAESDVNLKIVVDLGVNADENVIVLNYKEGKWAPIKSVTNNGDGTVTCEFEHLCPVAFVVGNAVIPGNEDAPGNYLWYIIAAIALVVVAVVVILVSKKSKKSK